ncbi:MAG: phenylpropionate dioxygenase-like ring-hydroxylating dioxygenase large terminal subunit [Gammaproteobacteria bacterium]|jgi:phenylpropionate dioxygenase-like ring-hydroxylating dioxygenase large terminal subunit
MNANADADTRTARTLPAEGENGLYSQSWFPICLSEELTEDAIVGRAFLGGRVIAFRDENGEACVTSAYCAHLGVDLKCGVMVDGLVRCPYHHFHYDGSGQAVKIGNGEKPPPAAKLFRFPTYERYGLVFAFNGKEPHFEFPDFSLPDDEIAFHAFKTPMHFDVDPWVIIAQTPDLNHTQFLHGPEFAPQFEIPPMTFTDHSGHYSVDEDLYFDASGVFKELHANIYGTNIVQLETIINDMWTGGTACLVPLGPNSCEAYGINVVKKADVPNGSPEAYQAVLDGLKAMNMQIMSEDQSVYQNIRFVQGALLECDRELANYFDYLRKYPWANPGREYINGEGQR